MGELTGQSYPARPLHPTSYTDPELYCSLAVALSKAVDAHAGLRPWPESGPLLREARRRGWLHPHSMPRAAPDG